MKRILYAACAVFSFALIAGCGPSETATEAPGATKSGEKKALEGTPSTTTAPTDIKEGVNDPKVPSYVKDQMRNMQKSGGARSGSSGYPGMSGYPGRR